MHTYDIAVALWPTQRRSTGLDAFEAEKKRVGVLIASLEHTSVIVEHRFDTGIFLIKESQDIASLPMLGGALAKTGAC